MKNPAIITLIGIILLAMTTISNAATISDYNIVWNSPSKDCNGSMPLGNGDIGANVWVEQNGDICFYISKTDAWSDNGRLFKVGKVRITCTPPLVKEDASFKQELDLKTGSIIINSQVSIFIDANNPVINVSHNSPEPVKMTAKLELWRTKPKNYPKAQCSDLLEHRSKPGSLHETVTIEPDTIVQGLKNSVGWFHHNKKSVGFELTNKLQGLGEYFTTDPILHRTFGGLITGTDATRVNETTLTTKAAKNGHISIHVLTAQPVTPSEWLKQVQRLTAQTEKTSFSKRQEAHNKWWHDFQNRSWIHISQNSTTVKRLIPESKHNIRIGLDQNGSNKFSGNIARVSLYNRALSVSEIAVLAKSDKTTLKNIKGLVKSAVDVKAGADLVGTELDGVRQEDLAGSVTIEAWIKPAAKAARIIDMVTPGGADGFLLDVYPANSLRFIVGRTVMSKRSCLKAGTWQHVAAVTDTLSGSFLLYLDGVQVAGIEPTGDDAFLVSRSYALQRFIDACAGRGNYPIKFNGSIFTVPYNGDPDYRRWGPGYWWQNTRLPYLSMCATGDYDLMQPFFKMYADDVLELNKFRTRKYLGHGGAFYPECMYFWGSTFASVYGWTPFEERTDKLQQSGWHKWEWVAGPELVFMMLDYYDYTQDETFLKEKVLPVALEVTRFFDEQYKMDDTGKLVMHPAMACETWWNCTNPMPELAGLHGIIRRLLALPENCLTKTDKSFYAALQKKLPPLPIREHKGVKMLAPAEIFKNKRNCENPELYAVFPFRLCSFEKDNVELGRAALKYRWDRGAFGWRQDDIFMTYLGLTDKAKKNLLSRCKNYDKKSRFPVFWGPNYDWVPDQDHGGVMMKTVQAMLMQPDPYSRKIYIAPAWPKEWNCEFKLYAPYRTKIEGRVENGEVVDLKVTPESRRKDIIFVQKP